MDNNKVVEEKNKPQLIAETPRAGKWNHRFIATKHGKLSDSDIAKIVAAARRNPQGDDYISVSVKREQLLSGRTGKEILVLTGIDVKKLSESECQKIVEQLEQRLKNDFDKLVTETIDWDKDGEAILLKRQELDNWENDLIEEFELKTEFLNSKNPQKINSPKNWRLFTIAIVILGATCFFFAIYY